MAKTRRNYTREMAGWASALKYEDIPPRIVRQAKLQITSVLASLLASSRTATGKSIPKAVSRFSDAGTCTVIPFGNEISLKDALAANSCLSMLLDFDDYMFAGHTGHSAVLVPLMLAQKENIDGRQLILAQVIANEIEARLGASIMIGPSNGQMWAFIHAAGTACAAGKILGLDEKQMTAALGMSLSQPAQPLPGSFFSGESKLFTASNGINYGILAAQLAAGGLSGPEDILESEGGFCETFSFIPVYPMLTRLGQCWLTDTLSCKIYPGCAYIDSAADGLFELMRENSIDVSDIFKVDIHASIMTVKMDEMSRPLVRNQYSHPMTLNFYTPYNIAVGLLDGELGPDQFTNERINDMEVWNLAKRVRVHHDIKMSGMVLDSVTDLIDIRYLLGELRLGSLRSLVKTVGPSSPFAWLVGSRELSGIINEGRRALGKVFGADEEEHSDRHLCASAEEFKMTFPARVSIEFKSDSGPLVFEQEIPFGAAGRPFEERSDDITGKFEKQAVKTIGAEAAHSALEKIGTLETLDNASVKSIIETCCFAPGSDC